MIEISSLRVDPSKQEESFIAPISDDSRLLTKGKTRILCHRNGWPAQGDGKTIVGKTVKELLEAATVALGMPNLARKVSEALFSASHHTFSSPLCCRSTRMRAFL